MNWERVIELSNNDDLPIPKFPEINGYVLSPKPLEYNKPYIFKVKKEKINKGLFNNILDKFKWYKLGEKNETDEYVFGLVKKILEEEASLEIIDPFYELNDDGYYISHYETEYRTFNTYIEELNPLLTMINATNGSLSKIALCYHSFEINKVNSSQILDHEYEYEIKFMKPNMNEMPDSNPFEGSFHGYLEPTIKYLNTTTDNLYLYDGWFYTELALFAECPELIGKPLIGISNPCDWLTSIRIISKYSIQKYDIFTMSKYIWGKPKYIFKPQEIEDLKRLYEYKRSSILFNKYLTRD